MGIPVTKAERNAEGLALTRKVENLQKHIVKIEAKNKKFRELVDATEEWYRTKMNWHGGHVTFEEFSHTETDLGHALAMLKKVKNGS